MIHPSAVVSDQAAIGPGTHVWHHAQVRERARIGAHCIIGKGVYIDADVVIGSNVKIQNGVNVYHGVTIEDGVFVGPMVCFTNDLFPRAITPDGGLKTDDDWEVGRTLVRYGASLGARAVILPNVTIGCWALVGAGAVVTRRVPDYGMVVGNPARLVGYACRCGRGLHECGRRAGWLAMACASCGREYQFPESTIEESRAATDRAGLVALGPAPIARPHTDPAAPKGGRSPD